MIKSMFAVAQEDITRMSAQLFFFSEFIMTHKDYKRHPALTHGYSSSRGSVRTAEVHSVYHTDLRLKRLEFIQGLPK